LLEALQPKLEMRDPLLLDLQDVNMDEYGW